MQSKIVYQTDHLGIYTGPAYADPSPLEEGVWLIPRGCVEVPPPAVPDYKAAHWDGQRWQLIDSYLGLTAYNTKTGEAKSIDRLGQLPAGYTLDPPGPGQVWQDGQWVDDIPATIERRYQERVTEIDATCSARIFGGFWSSALGDSYCYSTALDDQVNLSGAAALGVDLSYPCADRSGIKAYRPHTAAQLRLVADDFTRVKLQLLQQAYSLKERLQQARDAKDLNGINAVVWEADLV
ncbi:phage tail protein [Pseudomonas kurunegalensis]|uniref:phage tail protein n=1 Tax=Pseudomonas kurunegalensis TaxID=485880 RepID=UPI00257058D2|nr:phage tail protein [Pseudomonas kurunegalensis]WJD63104.1 phage tail protein [Pseudomonas kurunegalensis]